MDFHMRIHIASFYLLDWSRDFSLIATCFPRKVVMVVMMDYYFSIQAMSNSKDVYWELPNNSF